MIGRYIRTALLWCLISVFLITGGSAAYMLRANELYYAGVEERNEAVRRLAFGESGGAPASPSGNSLDIAALAQEVPGLVGWIYQEGTGINYPIMHRPGDNGYYLKHGPLGEQSTAGSIFLDGGCRPDFSDRNTIIYGHNMRNGSMFGTLKKYVGDAGYFAEHPVFRIYLADGAHTYKILSVMKEMYTDDAFATRFADDGAYREFLAGAMKGSLYDTGNRADYSRGVVTLSSCYSSGTEGVKTVLVLQEAPQ